MPYGPKSRSEHFRPREPDDYANHLYGIIKALNVADPIVVGASLGGETVLRYLRKSNKTTEYKTAFRS
jgi:pimeloyl-ACP methyl ester carboxylesterase